MRSGAGLDSSLGLCAPAKEEEEKEAQSLPVVSSSSWRISQAVSQSTRLITYAKHGNHVIIFRQLPSAEPLRNSDVPLTSCSMSFGWNTQWPKSCAYHLSCGAPNAEPLCNTHGVTCYQQHCPSMSKSHLTLGSFRSNSNWPVCLHLLLTPANGQKP